MKLKLMKKIGIFWGGSTDNTTTAALFMKEYLEMNDHVVEAHNIEETDPEKILEYDNINNGCLWHIGELQEDWDSVFGDYEGLDFNGKTAFFGCGDQVGYPANFLDAIGMLAEPFTKNGGSLLEMLQGYTIAGSRALDSDDKLMGLGLVYDGDEETYVEESWWSYVTEDIIDDSSKI